MLGLISASMRFNDCSNICCCLSIVRLSFLFTEEYDSSPNIGLGPICVAEAVGNKESTCSVDTELWKSLLMTPRFIIFFRSFGWPSRSAWEVFSVALASPKSYQDCRSSDRSRKRPLVFRMAATIERLMVVFTFFEDIIYTGLLNLMRDRYCVIEKRQEK